MGFFYYLSKMNNENLQTVERIKDKLAWAIRSLNKIKNSQHDKIEIQDNFWSFITAFQNAWNYYNHLIALKNPDISSKKRSSIGKQIIELWKKNKLSESEKKSWDVLQGIRNYDTHTEPVKPEIIERETILVGDMGSYLVDEQDRFLSGGTITQYFVYFNGVEFEILEIANNGINAIKKLIDYIPTLS